MSLKKSLALASVTALVLGALATSANATSAAAPPNDIVQTFPIAGSDLRINKLGTDAMGADSFANRNREFIDIKNVGAAAINIANYRTEDAWAFGDNSLNSCNTFKVKTSNVDASMVSGTEVNLQSGHTLRVHTGAGTPAAGPGNFHFVYMNSPVACGANGHYITNGADDLYFRDGTSPFDVVAHVRFNRLGSYKVDFPA